MPGTMRVESLDGAGRFGLVVPGCIGRASKVMAIGHFEIPDVTPKPGATLTAQFVVDSLPPPSPTD